MIKFTGTCRVAPPECSIQKDYFTTASIADEYEREHKNAMPITRCASVNVLARDEYTRTNPTFVQENVWGLEYHLKAEEARLSRILVRDSDVYKVLVKADFKGLMYKDHKEWKPVGSMLWGMPGFFLNPQGQLLGRFYVVEKTFRNKEDALKYIEKRNRLYLGGVFDEIFGGV